MTEDNRQISFREKVIGFAQSKAAILMSFKPGDLVTVYVSRESLSSNKRIGKFIGAATIKGESYQSSAPLWNHGIFPLRIGIEPLSQKCSEIKPLIQRLRFIKNKTNWGATFLPGIIKIEQEDFDAILECMK
jgi:predicted RNA-binding protein